MYAGRTHHTYLPQWYLDRQKEQAGQSSSNK